MRTIIALAVLTASVLGQEYPVGVVPGSPEDLAARKPAFRSSLTDLTRVGCELRIDFSDTGTQMFSPGSGVNTDYGVLTCWHCVKGHQFEVECDGEIARGVVIAKDEAADVALISVQWKREHPTVSIATGHASGILQSVARSAEGQISVEQRNLIGRDSTGKMLMVSPAFFASQSGGGLIDSNGQLAGIISGNVIDSKPFRGLVIPAEVIRRIIPASVRRSAGEAESAPTPYAEIERVLNLLPKPTRGFVDFGCGADARWCLAAAEKWQCKCVGMEIDPTRARLAQERVKQEGFADLIEIYCADSTAYAYPNCDVGIAFLYPETLQKLKPQIEGLTAFASMYHQPPVQSVHSGNAWIYRRPAMAVANYSQPVGYWNGVAYSGPQPGCNCPMCQSIVAQIEAQRRQQQRSLATAGEPRGHYEVRKDCSRGYCQLVKVWVPE